MRACRQCGRPLICEESLAANLCIRCRSRRKIGLVAALLLASAATAGAGDIYQLTSCRGNYCDLGTSAPVGVYQDRLAWVTVAHAASSNRLSVHVNGRAVPATVIHRDTTNDFALITTDEWVDCTTRVTMDLPPIGTEVELRGFPRGRRQTYRGTVRSYSTDRKAFFVDVPVESGTSGGPVIYRNKTKNLEYVIGVVSASSKRDTVCIPLNVAQSWFRQITPCRPGRYPVPGPRRIPTAPVPQQGSTGNRLGSGNQLPSIDYGRFADELFRRYGSKLRQDVDYGKLAEQLWSRYGDRIKGSDGKDGTVDYEQFAKLFYERYGPKLRGRDGRHGVDGMSPGRSTIAGVVRDELKERLSDSKGGSSSGPLSWIARIAMTIHPELRVPIMVGSMLVTAFAGHRLGKGAGRLPNPFRWLTARLRRRPSRRVRRRTLRRVLRGTDGNSSRKSTTTERDPESHETAAPAEMTREEETAATEESTDTAETEADDASTGPPVASPDEVANSDSTALDVKSDRDSATGSSAFSVDQLPKLPVDYASIHVDNMRAEGKDPAKEKRRLGLFVDAFNAIRDGVLDVGLDDPAGFVEEARAWIEHEFNRRNERQADKENLYHHAFYAYLHQTYVRHLKEGLHGELQARPAVAGAIERWVNAQLTRHLLE